MEDPDTTLPSDMWKLSANLILSAPNEPDDIAIDFEKSLPVKLTSKSQQVATEPTSTFTANTLARKHGVGRIDIVENRFTRLKSRGCRPPALPSSAMRTSTSKVSLLTVKSAPYVTHFYSQLLQYPVTGSFSPEREFLEASIKES